MTVDFAAHVSHRTTLLARRGYAAAAEDKPPVGQAGYWYDDVIRHVPRSGRDVARQLARLCGDDSKVTIPWRSLADAVGKTDTSGRLVAYTERGVASLIESGWLRVETVGRKRGARTTFYLLAGDRLDPCALPGEEDIEDAA